MKEVNARHHFASNSTKNSDMVIHPEGVRS